VPFYPGRRAIRWAGALVLCCLAALAGPVVPANASSSGSVSSGGTTVNADFNGDDFADLAIGVAQEDVGAIQNAGAVNVLYGTSTGLKASGSQFWHQDSPGIIGDGAESGDFFGYSLAAADFDGDGYADLAVGSPGENLEPDSDAGGVHVLYGSPTGLTSAGNQWWTQGALGLGDADTASEPTDFFGISLAAANFGNSAHPDLAVGVAGENVGAVSDAGAVNVIFGTASGLDMAGAQFWHQGSPGIAGDGVEPSDQFGIALAAGNLGKTAQADLAVGVRNEDVGTNSGAGAVNILYGSLTGLTATGSQFWHQDRAGIVGDGAEEADQFGTALAAGNFGKSSQADLAIGVAEEDVGATTDAGAVNVLYGSSTGLTASGDQFWHQNSSGIADAAEAFDSFGSVLAAANFGKGSQADLAIAGWEEGVGAITDAGAVNVLYGSSTGLTASGDQFWHQNVPGVAGDGAEEFDGFGFGLAAANFGKSTQADLAVGAWTEDVGNLTNAGAVNVLYGSSTGLTASGDQFWHQNVTGVNDDGAEVGDTFGRSLVGIR
jgi:nucleoside phosphorylase